MKINYKFFYILFASLLIFASCTKSEKPIMVVPGESIAQVELGMSRGQVITLLGQPNKEISSNNLGQIGRIGVLGGGEITGEIPKFTFLLYSTPDLSITLHENDKVGAIQLGYNESVRVKGYDFLKFKYLSKAEIERIGKPSSVIRDKEGEDYLLSMAPKGTKIEYYVYEYGQLGLTLGFVFDMIKEQSSENFIALNYIAVGSPKNVLPMRQ